MTATRKEIRQFYEALAAQDRGRRDRKGRLVLEQRRNWCGWCNERTEQLVKYGRRREIWHCMGCGRNQEYATG